MDKDNKDFALALYNKLWDNINNKDSRLWTFLSVYGAAVALSFSVGKLANLELFALLIIFVLTLWALFIVTNASWWDSRNRLMIGGIENRFPVAIGGAVPRAYKAIGSPQMEYLNEVSVMVLATVAVTMYLKTALPYFHPASIESWDVLLPFGLQYLLVGVGVWLWLNRVEEVSRKYYQTAESLRKEEAITAAAQLAANGVARSARVAVQQKPQQDQPASCPVADVAEQAVDRAVARGIERGVAAAAGANPIQVAAEAAAEWVAARAKEMADQMRQTAAAEVAQTARDAVAVSVPIAVAAAPAPPTAGDFQAAEKEARRETPWRLRAFFVLLVGCLIFDFACYQNASGAGAFLVSLGILLQLGFLGFYGWESFHYTYRPDASLDAYHLRLFKKEPAGTWSLERNPGWIASLYLASALACAGGVTWGKAPFPVKATGSTPAEIKAEREKLLEQMEALRSRSLELEEGLRKKELSEYLKGEDAEQRFLKKDDSSWFLDRRDADRRFLKKTDFARFLDEQEAKRAYASKADLEALRRELTEKKGK